MKGEEFGFKDTDMSSIEFIIEALNELVSPTFTIYSDDV